MTNNNNNNNNNTDQGHRRLFLVSVPRTASNLLVRVLNIQNQPQVVTNEKSGYFFFEPIAAATAKGYFTKPVAQWAPEQKAEIRACFQQCLDDLESLSDRARRQGKIFWTKEHAFWFVSPAKLHSDSDANSDDDGQESPFSLTFPDHVFEGLGGGNGTSGTFSQHNNTLFPDEYLSTWKFTFIIRHPALAWPSMYRALQGLSKLGMLGGSEQEQGDIKMKADIGFQTNMTWKWTRDLYQWCCDHQQAEGEEGRPNNKQPVILDAHDIIHDPEVVMKFCEETGLDKSVLQFEWEEGVGVSDNFGKKEEKDDHQRADAAELMTVTLKGSRGVIKDKAPMEIDIDAEAKKWKEEFGVEVAEKLEEAVRRAMPDYEYLKDRRLKVRG